MICPNCGKDMSEPYCDAANCARPKGHDGQCATTPAAEPPFDPMPYPIPVQEAPRTQSSATWPFVPDIKYGCGHLFSADDVCAQCYGRKQPLPAPPDVAGLIAAHEALWLRDGHKLNSDTAAALAALAQELADMRAAYSAMMEAQADNVALQRQAERELAAAREDAERALARASLHRDRCPCVADGEVCILPSGHCGPHETVSQAAIDAARKAQTTPASGFEAPSKE